MNCRLSTPSLLTHCREFFHYNPLTGIITRRKTTLQVRQSSIGDEVGYRNVRGYRLLKIKGHAYSSHRVAFLMHNGYLPEQIDHINGIKDDNRIINLRGATNEQNCRNVGLRKDNKSGYKGVSYSQLAKKWAANISFNGDVIHLGAAFNCRHEAARVYNTAARMYHGEFSYTNIIKEEN